MLKETEQSLNTESILSDISYKSFRTQDLFPVQNSYCDHRNFDGVNQPLIYCVMKQVAKYDHSRLVFT